MNFDSLKLTRLLSCGVQAVSSFPRHARCIVGETKDSPDLKNKHKQIAVLQPFVDFCVWKELRPLLQIWIGVIRLYLYLLIIHMRPDLDLLQVCLFSILLSRLFEGRQVLIASF